MKEYKVESSWTKLDIVLPSDYYDINPVCFTDGGELVGTKYKKWPEVSNNEKLVKVSNDGASVESQTINCSHSYSKMVMFTESLLSIPDEFGGTGEDQGK
ncbi:hypothetical protein PIB30_059464 [Stylosanthes scabra]|uniref:Uncharacterized protein n=1 Tax=Stylosanthes scabra TaxID=79078 RepID=A0ABU6YJ62_9FABA|nr:hypothetical protein [Stylosanthes scabra]